MLEREDRVMLILVYNNLRHFLICKEYRFLDWLLERTDSAAKTIWEVESAKITILVFS